MSRFVIPLLFLKKNVNGEGRRLSVDSLFKCRLWPLEKAVFHTSYQRPTEGQPFSQYCGKTLGDYICGKDSDRMSYDTPHILLLILILNSCIIKAIYLQPFYDETKTKSVNLTLSTDIRRHSVWGQTASIRCYGICRTSCPGKTLTYTEQGEKHALSPLRQVYSISLTAIIGRASENTAGDVVKASG